MLYAVIYDNRLLSLHASRTAAKEAARDAATQGVMYKQVSWLYAGDGTERCEVIYRADRRRRWIHSGYFVDAALPPAA